MSPIKRLLRRVGCLRWLALQNMRRVRQNRHDAAWEYTKSVLVIIGNITIQWAGISLMLNNLITWYQSQVGNVIRKDLPRDFTRKLRYLKDMEPDIRWSAEDRAKLRRIRIELARLNEFRVNIVHGLLWRRNSYLMEWEAFIAKEDGNRLSHRTVTYTNEEIKTYAADIARISNEISPFFARLIGLPHPENNP